MKRKIMALILAVMMIMSSVSVSAFALGTCKIKVDTVDGMPGQTITVNVAVENNPGILGLSSMSITYDSNALTLTNAENGEAFSALNFTRPSKYKSGCVFSWYAENIQDSDVTDGTILKLTFTVNSSATEGSYAIGVSCPPGNVYDKNLNEITPELENGGVIIVSYTPCDVNNDGRINSLDLILISRYIADGCTTDPDGYNVSIIAEAANVNNDGRINALDLILIARYIADGCKTDPNGYNVKPVPSTSLCSHTLEHVAVVAATCTVDGNVEYWHCTKCGKYFSNAGGTTEISQASTVIAATGHHTVVDPAVPATTTSTGLTEGSHCDVCGEIIVPQIVIPIIEGEKYSITYHIAGTDEYLAQSNIENPNPNTYISENGLQLKNLVVAGYTFEGWYNAPGSNGTVVTSIPAGTKGEIDLYAKWTKEVYTIQFDSPLIPIASKTYTVDTGCTLESPSMFHYEFLGWSDDNANLVEKIEPGTTGNITLRANWTSLRYMTRTYGKLADPSIIEDEESGQILFTYEIGRMENVPLYTLKDFGYRSKDALTFTTTTYQETCISESNAAQIAEAVSEATTRTNTWGLTSDWNKTIVVDEEHSQEVEQYTSNTNYSEFNENGNYSLGISKGGSKSTTNQKTKTDSSHWELSGKVYGKYTTEGSIGAGLNGSINVPLEGVAKAGVGADVKAELKQKNEHGWELGGKYGQDHTTTTSKTTTKEKHWNTNESIQQGYSATSGSSSTNSLRNTVGDRWGYSESSSIGGSETESLSVQNSSQKTRECASSVSYSTASKESEEITVTDAQATDGFYRLVMAGTIHVFAVVGYDIASSSYYVYTYNVVDKDTTPFLDYSKTSSHFDDEQNGVLPFEVPYFVNEYIDGVVTASEDLVVNTSTGTIMGYSGDEELVIIPDYYVVEGVNGENEVIKITGIDSNAFTGNTVIKEVALGRFINTIPDNAFCGCTSLERVYCGYITSVGANAFNGCTELDDIEIPTDVTYLGMNAFAGINKLTVNASNAQVAESAIYSGAKQITLNNMTGSAIFENKIIEITDATERFEFNGGNYTYNDFRIVSNAETTIINQANIVATKGVPLKLSSENVTLSYLNVTAPELALILTADNTVVNLYNDIGLTTQGTNAVLSKNVTLQLANPKVYSKLNVSGNYLVCGEIINQKYLTITNGEIVLINAESFDQLAQDSLEWVLESEMPAGATVVDQKWTYDETTYRESSDNTLENEGWTQYQDSTTTYGEWGNWSAWSTQSYTKSDTRDVGSKTEQMVASYNMAEFNYMVNGDRVYYKTRQNISNAYGEFERYYTASPGELTWPVANGAYVNMGGSSSGYNRSGETGYVINYAGTNLLFFITSTNYNYTNYYRYRDRTKTVTYYYSKTDSLESPTEIFASDTISNVQHWVKYVMQ